MIIYFYHESLIKKLPNPAITALYRLNARICGTPSPELIEFYWLQSNENAN